MGIGATTAVYSVVQGVLLKPLPFRDPDRLVALYHVTPASPKDIQGAATYFTYRDHGQVFEDIGLWQAGNVAVIRSGVPEQVRALRVTDGTLSLLEVRVTSRSDVRGLLGMADANGAVVGAGPFDMQLLVRIAAPGAAAAQLRALVERGCSCSPIPNAVTQATPLALLIEVEAA